LVFRLLRDEPRCRESDKWLCYRVYQVVANKDGKSVFIPFEIFDKFPSFETISRVRRKFNERGMFLPSSNTVIEREVKKEFVREWSAEG
jgi:hypothetical protein